MFILTYVANISSVHNSYILLSLVILVVMYYISFRVSLFHFINHSIYSYWNALRFYLILSKKTNSLVNMTALSTQVHLIAVPHHNILTTKFRSTTLNFLMILQTFWWRYSLRSWTGGLGRMSSITQSSALIFALLPIRLKKIMIKNSCTVKIKIIININIIFQKKRKL